VRLVGSRQGDRFVYLAIGIRPGGLQLEFERPVHLRVCDPLTGDPLMEGDKQAGERFTLPQGPGAWILLGSVRNP
jgi:hypothetical protein